MVQKCANKQTVRTMWPDSATKNEECNVIRSHMYVDVVLPFIELLCIVDRTVTKLRDSIYFLSVKISITIG